MARNTNNYVRILRFSGSRVADEYCVFFDDRDPVDVTRAADEIGRAIRARGAPLESVVRGHHTLVRASIWRRCPALPVVRVIGFNLPGAPF